MLFVFKGAVAEDFLLSEAQALWDGHSTGALQILDAHPYEDVHPVKIHLQDVETGNSHCHTGSQVDANSDEFAQARDIRIAKQAFAEVSVPVVSLSLPREIRPPIS